jgi:glycosyltransferase involved in cell wall biosynthesis
MKGGGHLEKNVCMFVWNHFTNDARVLRECTSLSSQGYDVNLICIEDPADPNLQRFEERNNRFSVHRVKKIPALLDGLIKLDQLVFKNKKNGLITLIIWALFLIFFPIYTLIITSILYLLVRTKLKAVLIRGNICLRMMALGYRKKFDVYHSNDLNTLLQGYICSKIRIRQKKLIYDSHEVQTSRTGYNSRYIGIIESFFIKRIDAMIVENHTRAQYNEDLYGFYPYVVHNYPFKQTDQTPDLINIHKMLNLPDEEKILLYQGGIQTGRGLDKLVEAAPLFTEGTLVFIGDGRIKPQLEKKVNEMGLNDRVKFIPKVPLENLLKYTRNAYLGFQVLNNVCFNHYSASSNKLFEYMMCNIPVVACDFPEIKRVVEGENIGLCVDSHDHVSIATAVNELLSNKNLHGQMKVNCSSARENYNWSKEQSKFLDVYSEVLNSDEKQTLSRKTA